MFVTVMLYLPLRFDLTTKEHFAKDELFLFYFLIIGGGLSLPLLHAYFLSIPPFDCDGLSSSNALCFWLVGSPVRPFVSVPILCWKAKQCWETNACINGTVSSHCCEKVGVEFTATNTITAKRDQDHDYRNKKRTVTIQMRTLPCSC